MDKVFCFQTFRQRELENPKEDGIYAIQRNKLLLNKQRNIFQGDNEIIELNFSFINGNKLRLEGSYQNKKINAELSKK